MIETIAKMLVLALTAYAFGYLHGYTTGRAENNE